MVDRPSTHDFLAFKYLFKLGQMMDILKQFEFGTREERRWLRRKIKRSEPRTENELLDDLLAAGEAIDGEEVFRVMYGVPKAAWPSFEPGAARSYKFHGHPEFMHPDDHQTGGGEQSRKHLKTILKWMLRWFSGKRYGLYLDDELSKAMENAECEVDGLEISIPVSPMVVKFLGFEMMLWQEEGVPYFIILQDVETDDEIALTGIPQKVCEHEFALAVWLCAVSKGEENEGTFNLKVGDRLIAVLPTINAKQIITKHRIAEDALADKGSWIRKGHFRLTKSGPAWVPSAIHRKELPFVHKVHSVERKGQELFPGKKA